jgi:hypothetical protein
MEVMAAWFWQRRLSVLCLATVFEKQSHSGAAHKRDDAVKTFERQAAQKERASTECRGPEAEPLS